MYYLRCEKCGVYIYLGKPGDETTPAQIYDNEWVKLHKVWHDSIEARINAAAQVGAHADLMTTPIG